VIKDLNGILEEIKILRETKGKEKETLELIEKTKLIALEQGDFEVLAKLYWEESLKWQHYVMNEASKSNPNLNNVRQEALKMENAALHADEIINEQDLIELKGVSHRFLGNSFRVNQKYDLAEIEFKQAIQFFKQNKSNIPHHLEVQGFLSAVYIFQDKIDEGIELAEKTFNQFLNDGDAVELKKNDFTTWVIWATGVFPRLLDALTKTNADFDKDLVQKYLSKSQDLLKNPENKPTWGKDLFKYRLDEIKKAKTLLEKLILIVITLMNTFKR
jgi:tetratricopeptide (TPR) repeat protein